MEPDKFKKFCSCALAILFALSLALVMNCTGVPVERSVSTGTSFAVSGDERNTAAILPESPGETLRLSTSRGRNRIIPVTLQRGAVIPERFSANLPAFFSGRLKTGLPPVYIDFCARTSPVRAGPAFC